MENQRIIKFCVGCIGTRLCLTYLAYLAQNKPEMLKLMGRIALLPALGFVIIYCFGLRKTGLEVNGELIWWDKLRPIHSLLWGLFAYLAINKSKHAWVILFIDTLLGLVFFLNHHKIL